MRKEIVFKKNPFYDYENRENNPDLEYDGYNHFGWEKMTLIDIVNEGLKDNYEGPSSKNGIRYYFLIDINGDGTDFTIEDYDWEGFCDVQMYYNIIIE